MIDLRKQLPRNRLGLPRSKVDLKTKTSIVVHYNGPPVPETIDETVFLKSVAHYHAFEKNWATPGESVIRGDGIMYTYAVGRSGDIYQLRDETDVLYHCGTSRNRTAIAIFCILGGEQRLTDAQLTALHTLCEQKRAELGIPREEVLGHVELGTTGSCPGTVMSDFIYPYRSEHVGEQQVTDGKFFTAKESGLPEGHFIGGGFWWFWLHRGGLPIFGYPLTEEIQEVLEDGKTHTVQYFERCVMEYHPEAPPEYQVQLRRLGAEALARKAEND
jgi:hypothetical protein